MSVLLALDPGIDVTGWAAFRTDGPRSLVLQQAGHRLLAKGSLRTPATMALPDRVVDLGAQLGTILGAHTVAWVAIEEPRRGGTYARHQQGRTGLTQADTVHASLAPMHIATGALILTARLASARVFMVPASGRPKPLRHRDVYLVWPGFKASRTCNADERDALYLGLQLVTDTRRRWDT